MTGFKARGINFPTMRRVLAPLVTLALLLGTITTRADIFRWDNGQVIPGTEGVSPGPGINLADRNSETHNLRYADFSGGLDLHSASFAGSWLNDALFAGADLTGVNLNASTLKGANLVGTTVKGAAFYDTTARGFTHAQLSSTASYQAKDLEGIYMGADDLSGWDFSGQNLANAVLEGSALTAVSLTGANLTNANLSVSLLTEADLTGANLTNGNLTSSTLREADLTGAIVKGACFDNTTSRGFTHSQLASTASYQSKELQGIGLSGNDLSGWNLSGQNLRNAVLSYSTLTSANLAAASLTGASLQHSTLKGADLTAAQLTGAYLAYSTLSDANLTSAELSGVDLYSSDLASVNLSGANLNYANLSSSTLRGANLNGAVIAGASFQETTSRGLAQAQLISTASYQAKDLRQVNLSGNELSGWDLSEQNLMGANLDSSNLKGANLSGTDTRGALVSLTGVLSRNLIRPDGQLRGLQLNAGDRLIVRDDDGVPGIRPKPWLTPRSPERVSIRNHLTIADGGKLQLVIDSDPWGSQISFQPGIPVELGGTLELTFAQDSDAAAQVGHTLHLFDWSGVVPIGDFTVSSVYDWDLSSLYTTGEVTLLVGGNVIAGDANGDGKVDAADFGTLKGHFGAAGRKAEGDANGDGQINLADFGLLKANFGKSSAAVPEPAAIILAVLGAFILLGRPRVPGRVAI